MAVCCTGLSGRFVVGVSGVVLLVGVRREELWEDSSETAVFMEGESVLWKEVVVGMLIT